MDLGLGLGLELSGFFLLSSWFLLGLGGIVLCFFGRGCVEIASKFQSVINPFGQSATIPLVCVCECVWSRFDAVRVSRVEYGAGSCGCGRWFVE